MRLRSIDVRYRDRTIADTGGEDRALLRSNLSAHAGARTRVGGLLAQQPSAFPNVPDAFWPQSDKPRGLGQSPKSTPRTGGTYVKIFRLRYGRYRELPWLLSYTFQAGKGPSGWARVITRLHSDDHDHGFGEPRHPGTELCGDDR